MAQDIECYMKQGMECFMTQGMKCYMKQGMECYMTQRMECYMTQEKECYMTQGMDCFMTWRATSSTSRYKELHAAFYYLYRTVSPRSKVVARYKVHPTYSKIIRVYYEILNNDNILSFLSKMIISGHISFGKRPW